MKTYDIELRRLKSTRHDKGVIESGGSFVRLPVEHARTLLLLLKQQLAELTNCRREASVREGLDRFVSNERVSVSNPPTER